MHADRGHRLQALEPATEFLFWTGVGETGAAAGQVSASMHLHWPVNLIDLREQRRYDAIVKASQLSRLLPIGALEVKCCKLGRVALGPAVQHFARHERMDHGPHSLIRAILADTHIGCRR